MNPSDDVIWVQSNVLPDGSYAASITVGQDRTWTMDRDAAVAHASAAVEAASHAEYESAVFALLVDRGVPDEVARHFIIKDVRPQSPKIDDTATAPFTFVPAMGWTGKPIVLVQIDHMPWAKLSPQSLREHALAVMEAPAAAALDGILFQTLVAEFDSSEQQARSIVAAVGGYRHGPQ